MRLRLSIAAMLVTAWVGSAWAVDGAQFFDKKCTPCHSIAGKGGKNMKKGGPLDHVGSKRDEAWLKGYLAAPKSKIENSKKPKMTLSTEQIDGLVAFLLTLK